MLIYVPELSLAFRGIMSNYYVNYFGDLYFSIYEFLEQEQLTTAVQLFPEFILILYLATLFIMFFFSFYSTYVNEEYTVDADFLSANNTVESEKELGSLDDMLFGIIIVAYIFG
jgi:hypothetical protein